MRKELEKLFPTVIRNGMEKEFLESGSENFSLEIND
jgi:hypothetical protein